MVSFYVYELVGKSSRKEVLVGKVTIPKRFFGAANALGDRWWAVQEVDEDSEVTGQVRRTRRKKNQTRLPLFLFYLLPDPCLLDYHLIFIFFFLPPFLPFRSACGSRLSPRAAASMRSCRWCRVPHSARLSSSVLCSLKRSGAEEKFA